MQRQIALPHKNSRCRRQSATMHATQSSQSCARPRATTHARNPQATIAQHNAVLAEQACDRLIVRIVNQIFSSVAEGSWRCVQRRSGSIEAIARPAIDRAHSRENPQGDQGRDQRVFERAQALLRHQELPSGLAERVLHVVFWRCATREERALHLAPLLRTLCRNRCAISAACPPPSAAAQRCLCAGDRISTCASARPCCATAPLRLQRTRRTPGMRNPPLRNPRRWRWQPTKHPADSQARASQQYSFIGRDTPLSERRSPSPNMKRPRASCSITSETSTPPGSAIPHTRTAVFTQ
jgi:hypothetical protein